MPQARGGVPAFSLGERWLLAFQARLCALLKRLVKLELLLSLANQASTSRVRRAWFQVHRFQGPASRHPNHDLLWRPSLGLGNA